MKSFDENGVQFAWSASWIALAETCLRKYQLAGLEGWTAKDRSVHLKFGGHFATALEHFHKRLALGEDFEDALISVVKEALFDTWNYPTCEKCEGTGNELHDTAKANKEMAWAGGNVTSAHRECSDCDGRGFLLEGGEPWVSGHNSKTRENLIRSIVWYIDHFADDSAKVLQTSQGPAVEQNFVFEVDNGILFAGHLDRIVEYAGEQYVMDQKTTGGTISPRWFEQFKPNTQMSMYTLAGKMILNSPVKGVIIDGAQIAVGFTRFERGFTFRTEAELEEWYDSAMYHIEAAQRATREQRFPMNTASCGNYGGCEFRHICGRDPSVRDQFLRGDFEKGARLDPLDQR